MPAPSRQTTHVESPYCRGQGVVTSVTVATFEPHSDTHTLANPFLLQAHAPGYTRLCSCRCCTVLKCTVLKCHGLGAAPSPCCSLCSPLAHDLVGQVAAVDAVHGLVLLGQVLVAQLVGAALGKLRRQKHNSEACVRPGTAAGHEWAGQTSAAAV